MKELARVGGDRAGRPSGEEPLPVTYLCSHAGLAEHTKRNYTVLPTALCSLLWLKSLARTAITKTGFHPGAVHCNAMPNADLNLYRIQASFCFQLLDSFQGNFRDYYFVNKISQILKVLWSCC